MKVREIDIPDNRPFIVRAAELKASNDFNPPNTLGKPRGKENPEAKRVMAMDTCIKNVLSGFRNELANCGTPMFVGYGLLSSISQEALIRAGVETIADEMTRKFVKFRYDVDDGHNNHEQEISDLEEEAAKYKIKDIFNDAAQKDGYFGGCLVYIDVGDLDDEEALEPLVLDKKTFKKGMLKGFKVIEPINIYPAEYNTTDPTDKNYFNPEYWYILGKRYHASRFLYFVGNSVPILLKPAYNFFGIARAQLALDYIAHFVENRESAQELLNKFSLTCWKTDMSQVLAGESCNDLVKRVRMFNKMKSNNGTLVVDKEQEDIMQINTPLGGVRDIVDMSLSLLTAVWRIPKIKYIGEGEGGLNASSKEQMRSFYDFILSQKEKMFTEPMEKVLKILQLNMGKDINESIGFEFPSLVEMDDAEIANLNKLKADTAVQLINAGVVSQEEVRQNLSMDKHSGFSMIDVDDVPEEPEQPNEKEVVEVDDEDLAYDSFEGHAGRTGQVGGSLPRGSSRKNALVMTEKQWEEYSNKWDEDGKEGYPIPIGKTLTIVKKNEYGGKDLHTDGEFYGRNLRSALSKFIKNSPKEVSQWNYLLEDNSDKELEEYLFNEEIDKEANYIHGEYIREEDGKSLYYFWTKNSIDGTVGDEDLIFDEFEESEHPRSQNGRFTNKHSGQTEKENKNGRKQGTSGTAEVSFRDYRRGHSGNNERIWVESRGSGNGSQNGVVKHTPSEGFANFLKSKNKPVNSYNELPKGSSESVKGFLEAFRSANKMNDKASAQVYEYPEEDYKNMRLFVAENGLSGFALKEDGDIVSVFSREKRGSAGALELAIAQGGKKLDCFDTFLPKIYKEHGLVEYKRDKWAEEYKPEKWDKEYFKQYNNGEPDVVYMKVDGAVVGDSIKKSFWDKIKGLFTFDSDFKESEHPRNSRNGRFVKKAGSSVGAVAEGVEKAKKNREYALSRISSPEQKKNYEDMFKRTEEINSNNFTDKDVMDRLEKKGHNISEIKKRYDMYRKEYDNAKRTKEGRLVDTQLVNSDDDGNYTPEREKLHNEIIDKYYINKETMNKYKVPDGVRPKVVVLGGRGGSGKSKLKGLAYDPEKYLILDVDEIKEKLPEYGGRKGNENFGLNAWEVHEESGDIAKIIREKARKNRMNIVLDMTCAKLDSTIKKIKEFEEDGYDVDGAFMELTRDLSTERSMMRGLKGRFLPMDQAMGMKDNEKVFEEAMGHFKNWTIWDNSGVGKSDKPKLVASTYNKEYFDK